MNVCLWHKKLAYVETIGILVTWHRAEDHSSSAGTGQDRRLYIFILALRFE